MSESAPETLELKPVRWAFLVGHLLPLALLLLAAAGAGAAVLLGTGQGLLALAPPAAGLALLGLAGALASVAYRKERYVLGPKRLHWKQGGLFSDEEFELEVKNITHVKVRLPWLRHWLFQVGDVLVESAGSDRSEVALRSIRDPEGVFRAVQERMRSNGFSIRMDQLLHEEQPDFVGILVECLGMIGSAIFVSVIMLFQLLAAQGLSKPNLLLITIAVWALGALVGLPALAIHFLDMRRRSYRVYTDAIVYEEGFLTRDNAFIPAENLADSNTKRGFVDQLIGLYDVHVSCQGTGQEVRFRRLRHGPELDAAVDRVVQSVRGKPRPGAASERTEAVPGAPAGAAPAPNRRAPAAPIPTHQAWTAELRPDVARSVIPWALALVGLFPLAPLWLFTLIAETIRALVTSYEVRPGSVKSAYRFLRTDEREFAYDKITGVVVKESPLDRRLGTLTVTFWSIGSGQPLELRHVRRAELNLEALLRQAGIRGGDPVVSYPAAWSAGSFARAWLPLISLLALVAGAGIVGGATRSPLLFALPLASAALLGLLAAASAWRTSRQRLVLLPEEVELSSGIFWRERACARYENVKKTAITRYPLGETGRVHFAVAGEQRLSKQGGAAAAGAQPGQELVIPYGFTAHHLPAVTEHWETLDALLEGEPPGSRLEGEPLLTAQPALLNAILRVALLPPFWLTIPLIVLVLRRRTYRVEPRRVVIRSGVLYRTQASVLYSRLDSLKTRQGLLHKLCGNGEVTLFTAGSSRADLVLADLPGWQRFQDEIRRRYGADAA